MGAGMALAVARFKPTIGILLAIAAFMPF